VITEAWIYDTEIFAQVKHYVKAIFEFMERNNVDFSISKGPGVSEQINPPEERWRYFQEDAPIVLVLGARRSGNFGYYFVHHPLRRLVWLDEYDFTWCVGEVHIEHTFSSIAHEMMSQYWKHVECFPHLYEFTQTDLKSMSDTIGFTFGGAWALYLISRLLFNERQRCVDIRYKRREYVRLGGFEACAGNYSSPRTKDTERKEGLCRGTQNDL
jgi:hypothetical protein